MAATERGAFFVNFCLPAPGPNSDTRHAFAQRVHLYAVLSPTPWKVTKKIPGSSTGVFRSAWPIGWGCSTWTSHAYLMWFVPPCRPGSLCQSRPATRSGPGQALHPAPAHGRDSCRSCAHVGSRQTLLSTPMQMQWDFPLRSDIIGGDEWMCWFFSWGFATSRC